METTRIKVAASVSLNVNTWPGAGPGFLLVHGLASNARLWDGVADSLAQAGLAVAALDQRGHGLSDKPDGDYGFATMCADLIDVIGELGSGPRSALPTTPASRSDEATWARPVLVGQSWGANVVLELAWRRPGILGGVACIDGGTSELWRHFPHWEDCARVLAPPIMAGHTETELRRFLTEAHADWPPSGIEGTMGNFALLSNGKMEPRLRREHHMEILRSLYLQRPSDHYADVNCPVLLMPAGGGGGAWSADKHDAVDRAMAAIPRGRVHWFEGADHDVHAQWPDSVAQVLTEAVADGFFD